MSPTQVVSKTETAPIPANVEAALRLAFEAGWEMAMVEWCDSLPPREWIVEQRERDWQEIRGEVYEKIRDMVREAS